MCVLNDRCLLWVFKVIMLYLVHNMLSSFIIIYISGIFVINYFIDIKIFKVLFRVKIAPPIFLLYHIVVNTHIIMTIKENIKQSIIITVTTIIDNAHIFERGHVDRTDLTSKVVAVNSLIFKT